MLNRLNLNQACTGLIEQYLGSAYDNVRLIADNLDALLAAANNLQCSALQSVQVWTDEAGESQFTFTHNPLHLDLYLNGLHLAPDAYQGNGETIVLATPLAAAEDVLVAVTSIAGDCPSNSPAFYRRKVWTPAIGTQQFAFDHNTEYLNVWLNGSKLVANLDYTSDGSIIYLVNATTNNGDILEAISFQVFYIANVLSKAEADELYVPQLTGITLVDVCNDLITTDHTTLLSGIVMTKGSITVGDGLADLYWYDSTSVAVDDGYDVIEPNSAFGGVGRWLRIGFNNSSI